MDSLNELNRILGQILGELKGINQRLDEGNSRMDKHDIEIAALNTFKDNSTGKISVISSVAGLVFGLIGSFFSHKLGI